MEAFLFSTGVVALAEIGDKTQLLSFVLAAKFRRPLPIALGILVATLINHASAGAVGAWMASLLSPTVLRWAVGLSFLAMAAWVLVPDRIDAEDTRLPAWGVFGTTVFAFFLAEMGDKTQVATVILASHYSSFAAVVFGTTLGMLLANIPAVYFGERIARLLPLHLVRIAAALMFLGLGLVALLGDVSQIAQGNAK